MSYDYLLYKKPKASITNALLSLFTGKMGMLLTMAKSFDGPPIGSLDEVKATLSSAFLSLEWQRTALPAGFKLPKSRVSDWNWSTRGAPEIALGADDQGNVWLLRVSRAELRQVKAVARLLHLGVIDEQAFE